MGKKAQMSKLIKLKPNRAQWFLFCGMANFLVGNYQSAVDDCTHALELNPRLEEAVWTRAEAHNLLGDIDSATVDYSKVLPLSRQEIIKLLGGYRVREIDPVVRRQVK